MENLNLGLRSTPVRTSLICGMNSHEDHADSFDKVYIELEIMLQLQSPLILPQHNNIHTSHFPSPMILRFQLFFLFIEYLQGYKVVTRYSLSRPPSSMESTEVWSPTEDFFSYLSSFTISAPRGSSQYA